MRVRDTKVWAGGVCIARTIPYGGMGANLKYLECLVGSGQDEEELGVHENKMKRDIEGSAYIPPPL